MLQLKTSIRTEPLKLPVKRALEVASRLGADAVELNARSEIPLKDMSRTAVRHLKKLLGDLNLKVSGLRFPTRRGYEVVEDLEPRLAATRQAMDLAFELGCSVVINQVGAIPDDPQDARWQILLEALTDLGNHAQKSGAWLAASTCRGDGELLRRLIDALPAYAIGIDFDPGDLIIEGHSAAAAIELLGSHVMSFRARDGVQDLSQGRGVEVQLGRGSVDWPNLLAVLEEHQYRGYVTIDRQYSDQFLVEAQQALAYLQRIFD